MAKIREINLPVTFMKEGNKFIAYTPALDVSTCGNTFEQAKKRFEEMVDIFFEELEEMGTLKEVLHECGWRKRSGKKNLIPPRIISNSEETFKVPCHD